MLRRFLVPLLTAAVVVPTVSVPACMASGAVVRVTSSSGIDRALSAAKAKGAGTTVYFKAGSYTHARPDVAERHQPARGRHRDDQAELRDHVRLAVDRRRPDPDHRAHHRQQ